jgi:hypothetical protein
VITNPEIVAELKRLAAANGGELQPRAIVEAARVDDSPLHRQFDWDDTEAAEKWRLHQARQLIRVIVAYEPVGDGKSVPCRVFVSLTPDREAESGYRLTASVLADPDQRRQLLADARADMKRFTAKYQALAELADVVKAMQAATAEELAHTG